MPRTLLNWPTPTTFPKTHFSLLHLTIYWKGLLHYFPQKYQHITRQGQFAKEFHLVIKVVATHLSLHSLFAWTSFNSELQASTWYKALVLGLIRGRDPILSPNLKIHRSGHLQKRNSGQVVGQKLFITLVQTSHHSQTSKFTEVLQKRNFGQIVGQKLFTTPV